MSSIPVIDPQDPVIVNVTVQVNPPEADLIRKYMVVSAGDTNIDSGSYEVVDRSSYEDIFTSTTNNPTYNWLVAFFTNAPNAEAYVLETGTIVGNDATANIAILSAFISAGTEPCYKYSCPQGFYGEGAFTTLLGLYTGVTAQTYFSLEITNGVDPSQDPNFTALAGMKSFFPCYGSGVSGESIDGAITGVMASTLYDLSASNPNTMLNYSRVLGVTAPTLSSTLATTLNGLGINYAGIITGITTIFNGRYADLVTWDYWYGWDWFQINTINTLTATIVNGANNPSASVRYDQNGIDTIKSVLNGVAKKGQSYGVVTDFGADYDFINDEITDLGSFYAIPFYTYIASEPTKYAQGKYDGLSGYLLIGRFIRQVVFNVTIN